MGRQHAPGHELWRSNFGSPARFQYPSFNGLLVNYIFRTGLRDLCQLDGRCRSTGAVSKRNCVRIIPDDAPTLDRIFHRSYANWPGISTWPSGNCSEPVPTDHTRHDDYANNDRWGADMAIALGSWIDDTHGYCRREIRGKAVSSPNSARRSTF